MPYYDKSGRRVERPVRRQARDGVPPPNNRIRKLVRDAKERHKKFTPAELKALLEHEGHKISLDVILGVLNGK